MSTHACPVCGEWKWSDRHLCPPMWLVWDRDYDDKPCRVFALDSEFAATKYAELRSDEGDGPFSGEVKVRPYLGEDLPWEVWEVVSEMVPEFNATKKG